MKKNKQFYLAFLIAFLILNTLPSFAQKRMVLIEGFQKHEIEVSDSLTEATVKEFYYWADRMHVDYETKLVGLLSIENAQMGSFRNSSFHKGTIYIEHYASQYPQIKRVIILYAIGNYYGGIKKPIIVLDKANEQKYGFNRKHYKHIRTIINQLPKEIR